MQATQISFITNDRLHLHGLHYNPTTSDKLAIFIHGTGDSHILKKGPLLRTLSEGLSNKDYNLMAFDNRGSRYISSLKKTDKDGQEIENVKAGMAYERIADCVKDIDGAINWGQQQGYKKFILIGHSTGANKIVYYLTADITTAEARNRKKVKKSFLLAGGDDISLQNSRLKSPLKFHKKIKAMVEAGKGQKLVPEDDFPGDHPISYGSLLELIEEDSDYDIFPFGRFNNNNPKHFARYKKLKSDCLAIYGSEDFGTVTPTKEAVDMLNKLNPKVKTVVIAGADHGFSDNYDQLTEQIVKAI